MDTKLDTFGYAELNTTPDQHGFYSVYHAASRGRRLLNLTKDLAEAHTMTEAANARIAFARENAFPVGSIVKIGKGEYRITGHRFDGHPKVKGEFAYDTQGLRNGKNFGPSRLTRHSKVQAL